MPNWVDNTLTVTGHPDEIAKFKEQAGRPYPHPFGDTREEKLSFWNFERPDDSILHEYMGEQPNPRDLATAMRHETNHWYDWNIRNWGCKWDARVQDFQEYVGKHEYLCVLAYYFDTAWAPPEGVLNSMSEQYPTLVFEMRSVEEQGWGYEYIADADGMRITEEWDIPTTHEEEMKYLGYCRCEEYNDAEVEYMHDDCPKKKEMSNA